MNEFLQHPQRVLWVCAIVIVANSSIDGSLLSLFSLHRDEVHLEQSRVALAQVSEDLKKKLVKAREPSFMEKEARDRFDLVGAGDLVFVFSDE